MKVSNGILLTFASFTAYVNATKLEPADGSLYIGAWLDTADSSPGAKDGDRPLKYNKRMGFSSSFFHYAQDLPIPPGGFPFPDDQIDETATDAFVLLTVYPRPNPWAISDADVQALANQCARLNKNANRKMLLRFAPEMNGNWFVYGQQPSKFKELWRRVISAVRASAPQTGIIFAPNFGSGYPYTTISASNPEFGELDTNKDGVIDAKDDPYSPYYPGDEYVDWVGMSVYTFGSSFPWSDNVVAAEGKFEGIINYFNFYQNYARNRNRPMMITETGAAFHVNTTKGVGVGELAVKQSWWKQFMTNAQFLAKYPKIKAICQFEFRKVEERLDGNLELPPDDLRDFRISFNTTVRNAFIEDLKAGNPNYIYGTCIASTCESPQFRPTSKKANSAFQSSSPLIALATSIFLGLLI